VLLHRATVNLGPGFLFKVPIFFNFDLRFLLYLLASNGVN
jgi:hypothetical protein